MIFVVISGGNYGKLRFRFVCEQVSNYPSCLGIAARTAGVSGSRMGFNEGYKDSTLDVKRTMNYKIS